MQSGFIPSQGAGKARWAMPLGLGALPGPSVYYYMPAGAVYPTITLVSRGAGHWRASIMDVDQSNGAYVDINTLESSDGLEKAKADAHAAYLAKREEAAA